MSQVLQHYSWHPYRVAHEPTSCSDKCSLIELCAQILTVAHQNVRTSDAAAFGNHFSRRLLAESDSVTGQTMCVIDNAKLTWQRAMSTATLTHTHVYAHTPTHTQTGRAERQTTLVVCGININFMCYQWHELLVGKVVISREILKEREREKFVCSTSFEWEMWEYL